jgi:hypothetical protein
LTDTQITDQAADATRPKRAGRPRPQETLERDEQAYAAIVQNGPQTSVSLGELMGVEKSIAYLCLWRLRKAGRVERFRSDSGAHTWRVAEAPAQ